MPGSARRRTRPQALELGYDAVLLNTAIAKAAEPVAMAKAFRLGVEAGRTAYRSRADGRPRLRLPFNPCRWDPVLACRILIAPHILTASIPSSTASPGSRGSRCSASAPSSCAPRTSIMPRRCRSCADALEVIKGTPAKLVVNDYWRAAIVAGAKHLHLGQEDLADADLKAIRDAGLTLGLSTHDDEELETALRAKPDYIALGPDLPDHAEIDALRAAGHCRRSPSGRSASATSRWSRSAASSSNRRAEIFAAGADSIAVVSDVTQNADPDARVRAWLGLNAEVA